MGEHIAYSAAHEVVKVASQVARLPCCTMHAEWHSQPLLSSAFSKSTEHRTAENNEQKAKESLHFCFAPVRMERGYTSVITT
jgi:hypothetical protein